MALFATAATAAMAAAPATPGAQAAQAAQGAQGGGIGVAIDSITPQVARPDSTVVVTGTVTNGTGSSLSGFSAQLYSSSANFTTRDDMNAYVAGGSGGVVPSQVGVPYQVTTSVRPGATATWHAEFNVGTDAGITGFGVYPLQVKVSDLAGTPLAAQNTLLPFWPASSTGIAKLKIAWVWPLIDQPHRQACSALTSNDLTQSLAAGGRLNTLLTAGAANPAADLTWAIDPALLGDAETMTSPYPVQGPPWNAGNCKGAIIQPASLAAKAWLAGVRTDTAGQPVVVTPYANTDVSALVHHGLNSDLTSAYHLGQKVAGQVLPPTFGMNLALPAGGLADQSVLTTLATSEHVSSVVLSSSEMPPADNQFHADDAVASYRTMAGTPMNVLLADDTLTSLLKTASANMSPGAQFALEQRFLAETAMIVSESPNQARSVVVSPPQAWGPSLALARRLLKESTAAPWLQPTTLNSLAGSHDAESTVKRSFPPSAKYSPRELSGGYLAEVSTLGDRLGVYKSMLYQPQPTYTTGLDEAVAATESSAWRGGGAPAAQGQQLADDLTEYLNHAQSSVKVLASPGITMAGSSGVLPVTIQNGLLRQRVQVKLAAIVPVAKGGAPPLTVARMDTPVIIDPGGTAIVRIHVSSAPSGTTVIQLYLTSKDSEPLSLPMTSLTVHSTRYGQAILILIAAAIGLLVLSSLFRAGRRWLSDGAHGAAPDPGSPGNVMEGDRDPTEAPDDLADARRWADDT
jgi:hypothetical protein